MAILVKITSLHRQLMVGDSAFREYRMVVTTRIKLAKGWSFFQHGLSDTSVGVCLNPIWSSLSYILADNGYDVWLGNNRGNGVSMINIYYSNTSKEFWDFSWDEMGLIDLPAQLNYVLEHTGAPQLTYIGHSEGTIQAFSGFISNTTLSKSVNLFVALAPIEYVQNIGSKLIQTLAHYYVEDIDYLLGIYESNLPNSIRAILPGVCDLDSFGCQKAIDILCGPTTYFNDSREDFYLHYEPNPTSVKNMAHWTQGVRTETFQMFNYGKIGNMKHYNQPHPPAYDLTKFPAQLPVALFTGGQDYLADPKDVQRLISLLPVPPFVHYEPTYAHLDPLLGTNAYKWIYPIILDMLENVWVNKTAPF